MDIRVTPFKAVNVVKDGKDAVVHIDDNATVDWSGAPAKEAKPAGPGYESELAQLLRTWNGKVDAQGNLLAKDGSVLTKAEPTDPLPDTFPDMATLLQWQLEHSWFGGQFFVDGQKYGQPSNSGEEAHYGSLQSATGKLIREGWSQPPVAPPVAVVPAGYVGTLDVQWPDKQVRLRVSGNGTMTTTVPTTLTGNVDHTGFIRLVEAPGAQVTAIDMQVKVNGVPVYSDTGNTSPGISFTVGGAAVDGVLAFKSGDKIEVLYAGDNEKLIDFASPARY